MTAALEGGEWSAARLGRTLPPGKTRYPLYGRLGGLQVRSRRAENLAPPGFDPRTVQPVVSRFADWATGPTTNSIARTEFILQPWLRRSLSFGFSVSHSEWRAPGERKRYSRTYAKLRKATIGFFRLGFHYILRLGSPLFPFTGQSV
jgi:hypothetical protein